MISIIVPVYNVKDYLEKCIQSILNQTYKDYELILVDDGSTDGCGDMCDEYAGKDNRVRVVHQSNQGLSMARNNGVDIANGDYLAFVDSDDWIESQMLERMHSAAIKYNADIVICRWQTVSADGQVQMVGGVDKESVMNNIDATKEILKDKDIPSFAWNKLYRRELFDVIRYPQGRIFEDTFTTYKLFYASKTIATIPYVGNNYRINPCSICNDKKGTYYKQVKRELDNVTAFGERYIFAKGNMQLADVVPICAFYAYQRMRSMVHLCVQKKLVLTRQQSDDIDRIFASFDAKDLTAFSRYEKLDLQLFKFGKCWLKAFLKIISIIHPLKRDL